MAFLAPLLELENCLLLVMMLRIPNNADLVSENRTLHIQAHGEFLFLSDKSDAFATFKSFVKRIHNEFEATIKKVRSNNGGEFKNTRVDELCDEFGIRHQFLAKYTPQSNGLVEGRIEP